MTSPATLTLPGSTALISADHPYDRQLLFEHVMLYARRHTAVRLALDGRVWSVIFDASVDPPECTRCRQPRRLSASGGSETGSVCLRCLLDGGDHASHPPGLRHRIAG